MTKLGVFQREKLKKYQPIVDYVEGRMPVTDFQKMFTEDRSLRKILSQRIGKQYEFVKNFDYKIYDMLIRDQDFADRNWDTIKHRRWLQIILMLYLDNFSIPYSIYNKYEEDSSMLIDIQPSWLYVLDDSLDHIVYEIPKDLSKTKQIAWGKQRVKELFKYDKSYPRWIQEAKWPIVNGKPLVFSHTENVDGTPEHKRYYFYDPDTNEQTVVEQFY